MPRPICVECRIELRVEKNGVPVKDPEVGEWPSTVWFGDLYECPVCERQIITGFGGKDPRPGEKTRAASLPFRYRVDDPFPTSAIDEVE